MKRKLVIAGISLFVMLVCVLGAVNVFALPDDPLLVLEAEEGFLDGNAGIWGGKVGNLGKCGGDIEGMVTFTDLDIPEDGTYSLMVYYLSGSDDRYFDITTDKGIYKLDCPNTGSFDTVGSIIIEVELEVGGVLIFGSDWYGPDLDRVEIYAPEDLDFDDKVYDDPEDYNWNSVIRFDTNNGVYSLLSGCQPVLAGARAETVINGEVISSDAFNKHECIEVEDENDKKIIFKHTEHPTFNGEMQQMFTLTSAGYVITELTVISGGDVISTNYISPMSTYQNSIKVKNCVFIQMPFDNDKWIEPKFISVEDLGRTTSGYEVGVFYNSQNSNGLVMGSVSHDTWKTGLNVYGDDGEIMGVDLFGGAADKNTSDTAAHGYVTGQSVSSPKVFIGFFEDWRNGLTAYGKANTDVVPAKQSITEIPFGYNSWGSFGTGVKYSDMVAVSNYIKENLQEIWDDEQGTVYVNIDSYWDYIVKNDNSCNLTLDEALAEFVKICKANGQKAGIYYTPFACWESDVDGLKNTVMEGSDYTYYDAVFKNPDGSVYEKRAGGYALDPTHPGTIARIDDRINYFISLGFEYIKLDFLTHGALEGDHYDTSVTTGIQAYNKGMEQIHNLCNGKMFVNLSIAPVFPYQYADGRRISCDAFASIDNTKHVLSYLSACFWHKEIYSYPDPDHLVVLDSQMGVGRCRVTSGVISGTSFLIGDNLNNAKKGTSNYNKIISLFGNSDIIAVAKLGKAFKPYQIEGGDRCADAYWCVVGDTLYFAAFNFGGNGSAQYDLSGLAEFMPVNATAKELWSGKNVKLKGKTLTCEIGNEDAAIYSISLKASNTSPDETELPVTDDEVPSTLPLTEEATKTPETLPSTNENADNGKSKLTTIIVICVGVVIVTLAAAVFVVAKKKKK